MLSSNMSEKARKIRKRVLTRLSFDDFDEVYEHHGQFLDFMKANNENFEMRAFDHKHTKIGVTVQISDGCLYSVMFSHPDTLGSILFLIPENPRIKFGKLADRIYDFGDFISIKESIIVDRYFYGDDLIGLSKTNINFAFSFNTGILKEEKYSFANLIYPE